MIIRNTAKNVRSYPLSSGADVNLVPGNNTVSDAAWKELKNHPMVKQNLQSGVLAEVSAGAAKEADKAPEGSELSRMKEGEAIKIVEGTNSRAQLEKWLVGEDRKKVAGAISDRIDELTAGEAKAEGK